MSSPTVPQSRPDLKTLLAGCLLLVVSVACDKSANPGNGFDSDSAWETGIHRNLFVEYGFADEETVSSKVEAAYQQLFFGDPDTQTVKYDVGEDMAYIHDINSKEIRSEGMSYGMIIAVMMDDKETFDRLWKFSKNYLQAKEGDLAGYFSWQLHDAPPFTVLDPNPAPDGEEYFAMALFFADKRWGSDSGIFDYASEANKILHDMVHKNTLTVTPIMHIKHKQIVFSPAMSLPTQFTDPSYHLPAFYELWALWAEKDNGYWREVAQVSRDFFVLAAHPKTGLFPEYATFSGEPQKTYFNADSHNSSFDAHRVIQNMAMDYAWFSLDGQLNKLVERLHQFYHDQGAPHAPRRYKGIYELNGTPLVTYRPESLIAMNAVGALASDDKIARGFVEDLWKQRVPTGQYRYYNGLLHMLGLLHVSGQFKIYGNPNLK